ncbi:TPA: response regulator [Klebsiella pneumoniae]|nr:response regulator [Escherichia coli]ELW4252672.1 response regulator [Salmonella enterica]HDT7239528.1 response regulator [Klebsiella pneumoniae]EMC5407798.1 response regulator [Salmonella enterica]HDT7245588.1 response regulator [Klebsiella pneumoniae]
MNKKLMLIFAGIALALAFAISTIVKYNTLLSDKSLYAITGTQENYAWATAKFSIQLADFYALVRSNDKDLEQIRLKLDILFSRVSVIKNESESTIPLYKEKDYKETIDNIYKKLEIVDHYIKQPSPDMSKIVSLVNDIEPDSKLLVNIADHAEVRQRTNANVDFKETKRQILILLYITGILTITLGIFICVFLWKLNKLLDSEKKAFNNKNAFLGIVGHELRTSLQAIISTIDAISQKYNKNHDDPQFIRLESAVTKIEMQMKDLSEFARIDNGNIQINAAQFNLKKIIDLTVDDCISALKKENVKIITDKIQDINIIGDSSRIMQIVENLVTNAIKYTQKGNVDVIAGLDSKTNLVIKVEDTGQGIPKDKIKSIFSPFERLKGNENGVPGFGMGLAIVNGLVKAMKGQIIVKSEVGEGSSFTVKIPVSLGSGSHELENIDNSIYEPHYNHLSILLVDDNEMSCSSLVSILESADYNVEFTNSPVRAFEKLQRKPYDLVLSDLQMPIMTGDELFQKIKSIESPNKETPFIFISAYANESPIPSITMLTKPVRIRDINKAINSVMESK